MNDINYKLKYSNSLFFYLDALYINIFNMTTNNLWLMAKTKWFFSFINISKIDFKFINLTIAQKRRLITAADIG